MGFDGLRTIGQIHVSVTDVDRSVAFYRDVLGIPFLFRVPGSRWRSSTVTAFACYLGVPESEEFRSRGVLYFTVDDIAEAHRVLAERGVDVPRRAPPGPPNRGPASSTWRSSPTRTATAWR